MSAVGVFATGVVVGWSPATLSVLALLAVPFLAGMARILGMARVVAHAVATVTTEAGLVAVASTREWQPWRARIKRLVARWRPDDAGSRRG